MKHVCLLLLCISLAAAAEPITLRIRFGMKDTDAADWSGSIKVTPGRMLSIHG